MQPHDHIFMIKINFDQMTQGIYFLLTWDMKNLLDQLSQIFNEKLLDRFPVRS